MVIVCYHALKVSSRKSFAVACLGGFISIFDDQQIFCQKIPYHGLHRHRGVAKKAYPQEMDKKCTNFGVADHRKNTCLKQ
jgi:hypothetical protein